MQGGGSRSEGGLPQEIINLITGAGAQVGIGETQGLFPMLVGQLMGIMSGQGVHEWVPEVPATQGYWITPSGGAAANQPNWRRPGDDADPSPDPNAPPVAGREWIPGTPAMGGEWVPTGEGGVQIPLIAQAQEQQRRATSQAMTGTQENLARSGLAGTPFGEMILGQQRQQGAQAVAGVESDIMQQLLSMVPGLVTGNIQSVMGATSGARETDAKSTQFGFGT